METMTRTFTLGITAAAVMALSLAAAPRADAAIVLVGWDNFADATGTVYDADTQVLTGSISTTADANVVGSHQSTDGTYGTFVGASTSTNAALRIQETAPLTFIITNNTGQPYSLEGFHFDYARSGPNNNNKGPSDFTLTYISGGLGPDNTQIANVTGLARHITGLNGMEISDYPDFDFNLASVLNDTQLDPGESATFVLTWAGADKTTNNGFIDNIAITGTLIPEPGTLALLIAGSALMLSSRRRNADAQA